MITNNEPAQPTNDPSAKLLLTEVEAAKLLSISPRSLWSLRRAGRIRFIRIGTAGIRYSHDHLREFIESHTQTKD